ncbi:MAG TPA: hypothetical protein VMU39_10170 [Solirubrobacteraceae bacterium]|nr:hypothetical protein [Solirubrobacteraceae bacterium]
MTDKARLTIAAVITALFLAAISAAGLLAHSHLRTQAAVVPSSAQPTPATPVPTTTFHQEHD